MIIFYTFLMKYMRSTVAEAPNFSALTTNASFLCDNGLRTTTGQGAPS
jgi:hypothetical protein